MLSAAAGSNGPRFSRSRSASFKFSMPRSTGAGTPPGLPASPEPIRDSIASMAGRLAARNASPSAVMRYRLRPASVGSAAA